MHFIDCCSIGKIMLNALKDFNTVTYLKKNILNKRKSNNIYIKCINACIYKDLFILSEY